jgi:hypothetical protein
MDHRVSKDMISSGMSYTGQKSQEELGGSQYGSVARPDNLLEAYSSIYEAASSNPADVLKVEREKKEVKQTPKPMEENFTDVFDIIKDYLLGEGYADNEESAFVIMRNMSEEWKKSIVEQSAIAQRAAAVVDDQRRGSYGMADDLNKTRKSLDKLKPYPNGFPNASGVKGV